MSITFDKKFVVQKCRFRETKWYNFNCERLEKALIHIKIIILRKLIRKYTKFKNI